LYNGLYIEPFRLTVTEVHIPQAPAFLPDRPLRIIQISDLHLEHITSRELAMLQKAKTLTPDLIVMTGDYLNRSYLKDPETLQEARQLLSQLHAPYGVYAVNGNYDKPSIMSSLFDGIDNIRVLDDEVLPILFQRGTLYLIGASTIEHNRDYVKIESLMTGLPPDVYSILLYHYPERVDSASSSGVDLFLAGDTHGGQVRLPLIGTVTVSQWANPFSMGKYQVGPTTLFVSRGLGMQGGIWPRIRLNCPPEIVLVSLGK
jgi:predicted MPP superfamily phosphohydrolase